MARPETVSIQQAQALLPQLLEQVAAGAEVVIAHGGLPLARLVAVPQAAAPEGGQAPLASERELGGLAAVCRVPSDIKQGFAADIDAMFYGRG